MSEIEEDKRKKTYVKKSIREDTIVFSITGKKEYYRVCVIEKPSDSVTILKPAINCLVIGPGFPVPIVRPSTQVMGATSAAVPVQIISSAVYMSKYPEILLRTVMPSDFAISRRTRPGYPAKVVESRRGKDFTIFHDVEIIPGSFRQVAVCVEEDRFIAAFIIRFYLRKDIIEIVKALDIRRERLCGVSPD